MSELIPESQYEDFVTGPRDLLSEAERQAYGNTGCPHCFSDDYLELDEDQLARGGYFPGPPVYRCEECGEEWS